MNANTLIQKLRKEVMSLAGDNIEDRINGASLAGELFVDAFHVDRFKFGISGTPCFLVNDLVVRGAVAKDLFEEAIEMAQRLGKKK